MANPQIDPFMHALMWKAVPIIILAGIVALLLRELLQWLGRKATGSGGSRRAQRDGGQASRPIHKLRVSAAAPHCPECNSLMVKRKTRKGTNAGQYFWGCPRYPDCFGMRDA